MDRDAWVSSLATYICALTVFGWQLGSSNWWDHYGGVSGRADFRRLELSAGNCQGTDVDISFFFPDQLHVSATLNSGM
jgi:hypothetical protein